jgi:speckle-type POZ protein
VLLNTVTAGVLASFELRLVNQSTGLPFTVHKEALKVFDDDDNNMEAICWIKRSLLESPTYLQNDRLTVECIITVIKEPQVPKTKSFPRIEVPPSNMAEHFGSLLETNLGADVTFSVGAETFKAHKIVLATRSPVFKAELYGPMKEEGMGPITIKDVQPDVFKALLHFIYTDSLPPLDALEADDHSEMIRHLLVAAERFAIERLKLICQSFLCENLNVQTVATTLALADQHNCDVLKEACIEFITCSNVMDNLLSTQGYKNLKRTCPAVVMDALEKTSKFRKA